MLQTLGVKPERLKIPRFQLEAVVTFTCRSPVPWVLFVVEMERVALAPDQVPLAVRLSQLLKSWTQTTVAVGVEVTVGVKVFVAVKVWVGRVPVGEAEGVAVALEVAVGVPVAVGVKVAKLWLKVSS